LLFKFDQRGVRRMVLPTFRMDLPPAPLILSGNYLADTSRGVLY
jgi:hypothetical protein